MSRGGFFGVEYVGGMIELNFRLEAQDLAAFVKESKFTGAGSEAAQLARRGAVRSALQFHAMYGVAFAFAAWQLWLHHADQLIVGMFVMLVVVQAWTMWSTRRLKNYQRAADQYVESMMRSGAYDMFLQPCRYAFDESGVAAEAPDSRCYYSWRFVSGTEELPVGIGVHLANGSVIVLPKGQVESCVPAEEFVRQIQAWMAEHGRTDMEAMGSFLSDRDIDCLKCGYNLRGLVGASCPECGETLSLSALRQSAAAGDRKKRR